MKVQIYSFDTFEDYGDERLISIKVDKEALELLKNETYRQIKMAINNANSVETASDFISQYQRINEKLKDESGETE